MPNLFPKKHITKVSKNLLKNKCIQFFKSFTLSIFRNFKAEMPLPSNSIIREDLKVEQNNLNDSSAKVLSNISVFSTTSDKMEEEHEKPNEEIIDDNAFANMGQITQVINDDYKKQAKSLDNESNKINIANSIERNNTTLIDNYDNELYDNDKAAASFKLSADAMSNDIEDNNCTDRYENDKINDKDSGTKNLTARDVNIKNEKGDKTANTDLNTFICSPKNSAIKSDNDPVYKSKNKEIIRSETQITGSLSDYPKENINLDIVLDVEAYFSNVNELTYENIENKIYSPTISKIETKDDQELIRVESKIFETLLNYPGENMNSDKYEKVSDHDLKHLQPKLDEENIIPAFIIMKNKSGEKYDGLGKEAVVDQNTTNVCLEHGKDNLFLNSDKVSIEQTTFKTKLIKLQNKSRRNFRDFNRIFPENKCNKDHTVTSTLNSNFTGNNTKIDVYNTKYDLKCNELNFIKDVHVENIASTSHPVKNMLNDITNFKNSAEDLSEISNINNPESLEGEVIQNVNKIDTDSDYNSSDFEFIEEKDAKSDLLIDKTIDNIQYDFSNILNRYKCSRRFQNKNRYVGSNNYQNRHVIPVGDDYLRLFRENEYHPVFSNIQLLEKKSIKLRNDQWRLSSDMLLLRPENSDDENDEVKATMKKIQSMYPRVVNTCSKRRRN